MSVVCGDDLDKSENEENAAVKDGENEEKGAPSEERSDSKPEENCKEEKSAADKESEQIGKGLFQCFLKTAFNWVGLRLG